MEVPSEYFYRSSWDSRTCYPSRATEVNKKMMPGFQMVNAYDRKRTWAGIREFVTLGRDILECMKITTLGTERKQLQIFSALKRLTVPSWDYILISYDYETTARWTYLQLKVILFLAVLQLGSSAASSRGLHVRYGSWPPGILSWVTRCCQAPMNYKKKEGSSLETLSFLFPDALIFQFYFLSSSWN